MLQMETANQSFEILCAIANHLAVGDPLDEALSGVVQLAITTVNCDACFIYVLEGEEMRLWVWQYTDAKAVEHSRLRMEESIAKLLAERCAPSALANEAERVTFKTLGEWSQNHGETFIAIPLLSRKRLVGIIHLQHHRPHVYSTEEIKALMTACSLVAADINLVRLQTENSDLLLQLETRKLVERGKGILQRDLGLDEEQAYLALQRQSRQKRKSMKEIAEAVVMNDEVRRSALTM
jgi:uroporphyrinogen-III synthase